MLMFGYHVSPISYRIIVHREWEFSDKVRFFLSPWATHQLASRRRYWKKICLTVRDCITLSISLPPSPTSQNDILDSVWVNQNFFEGDLRLSEPADFMAPQGASILFVDAYDSFSQNIVALLHQELKVNVTIIKIDTIIDQEYDLSLAQFLPKFNAVVLGPGPGDPRSRHDGGNFWSIIECAANLNIPILGICLGFQILCLYYGLSVERMSQPCHGHTKRIIVVEQQGFDNNTHNIFQHIDRDNIWATCYNSLCVQANDNFIIPRFSRPGSSSNNSTFSSASSPNHFSDFEVHVQASPCLKLLAEDEEHHAMAFVHQHLPFWGVQFHPESCKSNDACHQMLRNWLIMVNRHNIEVRQDQVFEYLPDVREPSEWDSPRDPDEQQWSKDMIIHELSKTIKLTRDNVQWRSIRVSCTRQDISELVNNVCSDREIAMLESTKKGRFSIYAITGGWTKSCSRQPHVNIAPTESVFVEYRNKIASIRRLENGQSLTAAALTRREDVMNALEEFMISRRATGGATDVPFWGGFIGYMSYENGLDTIRVDASTHDRIVDDISLMWVERSLVFDAETSTLYIQTIKEDDKRFIDAVSDWFDNSSSQPQSKQVQTKLDLEQLERTLAFATSRASARLKMPNRVEYTHRFDQCQEHLHSGNSYELCLTTEAQIKMSKQPSDGDRYVYELYKNLHRHNPVPFGAYLNFPETTILSTSPEQYMSWTRTGTIDMIPMKGTVKRSPDMTLEHAIEILSSPKEQAENLMIADLIRHDLYSTVGHGSLVQVIKLCQVTTHETVYQLVSHIRAYAPIPHSLSPSSRQAEVIRYGFAALRTTLPPGSMTGAPKKRSCELLHDIEARSRGVYSGVLGFLDVGGGGCWSVCIRTAFRAKEECEDGADLWRVGAGGAITVLSSREGEWEEMQVKLQSVLRGFVE